MDKIELIKKSIIECFLIQLETTDEYLLQIMEETNKSVLNSICFEMDGKNLQFRFDGLVYDILNDWDSKGYQKFEHVINKIYGLEFEFDSPSVIDIYL